MEKHQWLLRSIAHDHMFLPTQSVSTVVSQATNHIPSRSQACYIVPLEHPEHHALEHHSQIGPRCNGGSGALMPRFDQGHSLEWPKTIVFDRNILAFHLHQNARQVRRAEDAGMPGKARRGTEERQSRFLRV